VIALLMLITAPMLNRMAQDPDAKKNNVQA